MQVPIFDRLDDSGGAATERLLLPFELRQKAQQRIRLESGREAGLKLPRGTVLRDGDVLASGCGLRALVVAAPESVSTVRSPDVRLLARAAYHLGNRHVWVELGDGWVRYLSDHVLDQMLRNLGLSPITEIAPFEPEAGAYAHAADHQHHAPHAHE